MSTQTNPETGNGSGDTRLRKNRELRRRWVEARHRAQQAREAGNVDEAVQYEAVADNVADEFVRLNSGLAWAGSKAFSHRDADDHAAAGLLGLWEAFVGTQGPGEVSVDDEGRLVTSGWDPDASTFGTYSRRYIEGRAARSVAALEPAWQGKSYTTFSKAPAVRAARQQIVDAGGDPHDLAAVAAAAGVSVDVVSAVLAPAPASLDAPVGDADGATLGEVVDVSFTVSDGVSHGSSVSNSVPLSRMLAKLPLMETLVFSLRNGLHGGPERSLLDTASTLFAGRGSVSNSHRRAEERLRLYHPRRLRAVVGSAQMRLAWDVPLAGPPQLYTVEVRHPSSGWVEVASVPGRSQPMALVPVDGGTVSAVRVSSRAAGKSWSTELNLNAESRLS